MNANRESGKLSGGKTMRTTSQNKNNMITLTYQFQQVFKNSQLHKTTIVV